MKFSFVIVCIFLLAFANILPHENEKDFFLLITGCGRSGTTYIAKLLTSAGLNIGHERLGSYGCASWVMAVDDVVTPNGPGKKGIHFQHIFHQVRHPLNVIASTETMNQNSWEYICKHIPQIKMEDPLPVRCAKYWLYWNLEAEKIAEWRYLIEDIDTVFLEMSARLGIHFDSKSLENTSRKTNTRSWHRMLNWNQLRTEIGDTLFYEIVNLAVRYGYAAPANNPPGLIPSSL